MSIGILLAGFAAASALLVWHRAAATKQVSEELLKEYERLLSGARDADAHSEDSDRSAEPGHAGSD